MIPSLWKKNKRVCERRRGKEARGEGGEQRREEAGGQGRRSGTQGNRGRKKQRQRETGQIRKEL